jgi:shikimate kinase
MLLPARVFLIGFSASGKSTVAPLLAGRLDYKPVDSDAEIERLQGMPCQQIIDQRGLDYFRDCERVLLETLCRQDSAGIVAALGGGAVTIPGVPEQLRHAGVVVWLRVALKTVISRLPDLHNRPLLTHKSPAEISRFMELREPVYEKAAHARLDVDGLTPDEITRGILLLLEGRLESIASAPPPQSP